MRLIKDVKQNHFSKRIEKVVVVAYPMGRCGSSALMGMLGCFGIALGKEENLFNSSPMNPKGFFELKSQENFLRKVYSKCYPEPVAPPSIEYMHEVGRKKFSRYEALLKKEFRNKSEIAVKSQRFLTLPFLYQLKEKELLDVYILVLHRNLSEQARSTLRVWKNEPHHPIKSKLRQRDVEEWLATWYGFSRKVRDFYDFNYMDIQFEELMSDPVQLSERLSNFAKIDICKDYSIERWIDRSLVNRDTY